MAKKRRKLNKDFEKKIYTCKKNVELVLAKIYDIDDEDIQKEYMSAFNEVVHIYEQLKINLENAWYVEYRYSYSSGVEDRYYLRNKLMGIDQHITKQQAQTPEQIADGHTWVTIDGTQAKELAIQLGLAS